MTEREALKLALEALENLFGIPDKWTGEGGGDVAVWRLGGSYRAQQAITAIKEALAQPEQEPVAWLLTDKNINSLQVDSIQRLIDRLKHAHHTDLCVRINGQDEWFQADWLKHMVRASPPQRTWVGLTDGEVDKMILLMGFPPDWITENAIVKNIVRNLEAKLKEKNHG